MIAGLALSLIAVAASPGAPPGEAVLQCRGLLDPLKGREADDPRAPRCLQILGEHELINGDPSRAAVFLERSVSAREASLGRAHPDVLRALEALGVAYEVEGPTAASRPLYQRAGDALRQALRPGGPRSAPVNDLRGAARTRALQLTRAEPRGPVSAREEAAGEEAARLESSLVRAAGAGTLEQADCLESAAGLALNQGDDLLALPLLARAVAIREARLGGDHPDVASAQNNLANLYHRRGRDEVAEALYERAIASGETALGKDAPAVAYRLNNLAELYTSQGLHPRAGALYGRALAILEAALGKDHPDVAYVLDNIGVDSISQGQYALAEPPLLRALAIREAAYGPHHPLVANVLNNLAAIDLSEGLFDQAEERLQRALAIAEDAPGPAHLQVVSRLNILGHLYRIRGRYDRAQPVLLRALRLAEAGPDPRDAGRVLGNLAGLYIDRKAYDQVGPLLQRARALCRGGDRSCSGDVLEVMAAMYASLGALDRSRELLERVLKDLDPGSADRAHPDAARLLVALGQTRLARGGDPGDALPFFRRALSIADGRLRREALGFSGARLASFLQLLHADEERLYALVRRYPDDERVRRLALTATLLFKSRSVEETAETSRAIYRSLDAEDRDAFDRLRALRTELASVSLYGPGGLSSAERQERLDGLVRRGDALEADLAKRSAPMRAITTLPSPDDIVDRVAASMPRWFSGRALVEFVAYTDAGDGAPHVRYLALLLFPGGASRAVDLGPAAPIDQATAHLRDRLASRDASFMEAAQELHRLVFQPLAPWLWGVNRLYVAPDGQLALIPFEALHDGKRFLVDTYTFTYLTSGKDLLPAPEDIAPRHSVVALADPDFSATATAVATAERSAPVGQFFATRRDIDGRGWVALPGTRQEAEALRRSFPQAKLLLGRDASKQRLLGLVAPGILHIATHGFFLEDATATPGARGIAAAGPLGSDLPAASSNPLLRSGLVLAGAREPRPGDEPGARHFDDTLVTALELAGLDLWGTQLAVLSACDTGRGEVHFGQGVYGLRRALVVAGAETVVISLWKVNDETTRSLMEQFYRNLAAGKDRSDALREAMLAMRAENPHPFYWAPFIVLGRDGPLRGLLPP